MIVEILKEAAEVGLVGRSVANYGDEPILPMRVAL